MPTTQLTRFLDPAAESRAMLTRFITVLGLDLRRSRACRG
jgi:hypothetical protein